MWPVFMIKSSLLSYDSKIKSYVMFSHRKSDRGSLEMARSKRGRKSRAGWEGLARSSEVGSPGVGGMGDGLNSSVRQVL